MKKTALVLALFLTLLPFSAAFAETSPSISDPVSTTIIVKLKDDSQSAINSVENAPDTTITGDLGNNTILVQATTTNPETAADALESLPSVEYAEPNYERAPTSIPTNDTYRNNLWALENTGQTIGSTTGTVNADIDGKEAWGLSVGTSSVVALIDSGVLYTHPDLAANMWNGTSCVDETGAALGNCIHGYDFADNDKDPFPVATSTSFNHGTHVAGTIAALKDNGIGVIGVAPASKIMALRFGFDVASEVRAIDFARQNGAKIINASFGGADFSQAEYDAIQRFTNAGGLFVASAGNSSANNDVSPSYPAAYDLPGIISVAATDQNDALAYFSNYGTTTVDIGAPGVNIASTFTTDASSSSYAYADGTSMAAPQVTGTIALIESLYPLLTSTQVKNAVMVSGNVDPSLAGKIVTGMRLNADRALLAAGGADYVAPVITLTGSSTMNLTVGDTFTDPGATGTDNIDATTTVVVGGDVISTTTSAGTYHITYDATDTAGNHAIQQVRTVIVSDPVVVVPPAPLATIVTFNGGGGNGGGGGGGGGGSSISTVKTTPVAAVINPARPALATTTSATTTTSTTTVVTNAPVSFYHFTRTLKVGSRGADVTALQQALAKDGFFQGDFTTYFGKVTQAALKEYQRAHSLEAVGYTGPQTRALLNEGL